MLGAFVFSYPCYDHTHSVTGVVASVAGVARLIHMLE